MADKTILARFPTANLPEGALKRVQIDGGDAILVRHGGRVCALSGTCTHLGAPLADGLVVDGEIRCPWHHARFSLDTGEAVGAPAFAPLTVYHAEERDGALVVTAAPQPTAVPIRQIGRVVIVGGGGAGHACAEMLGRLGAGGDVTLLSDDPDAPYDRTFCSKQYLAGEKERDEAMLPASVGTTAATIRRGVTVDSIDPDAGRLVTMDGETIAFDTLVLATGSAPVVPHFEADDRDDVFVLRTLADADRLIAAAGKADAAVVLGSSYVALEAAASLTQREVKVAIVAEGDVPLEKTAGSEIGAMVRALHEEHGVTFHMGRTVVRWTGKAATLDDGSTVAGDLLVAGTGVEPRLDLAKAAGLAIADKDAGGGVAVDATLRTSHPKVYAIGDIASVPDPRLGHPIRVEHWVVAQRMGQWLARHLLGVAEGDYGEVPFFWSGHYDSNLRYVGHVASPDDRRTDGDLDKQDATVTFREEGRDQAVLTCGRDRVALEVEAAWTR